MTTGSGGFVQGGFNSRAVQIQGHGCRDSWTGVVEAPGQRFRSALLKRRRNVHVLISAALVITTSSACALGSGRLPPIFSFFLVGFPSRRLLLLPPPDSDFSSLHLPNLDACSKILLDSDAGVTFDSAVPLAIWVPLIAPSQAGVFPGRVSVKYTLTINSGVFGTLLIVARRGYIVIEKKKGSFDPCPIESEPANLDSFSTTLLFSSLSTGSVNCE